MVALIIARSPLRYLPSSHFGETTTGAPLVVKGEVFVGISGGEGSALGLSRANRYPAARTRGCALQGDLANRSIERRSFTKLA